MGAFDSGPPNWMWTLVCIGYIAVMAAMAVKFLLGV